MAKFKKKPVVIEAIQFQKVVTAEFLAFVGAKAGQALPGEVYNCWEIETLEGVMRANPGDWIIRGVNGELYPCKPDIFEKTYDAVVE